MSFGRLGSGRCELEHTQKESGTIISNVGEPQRNRILRGPGRLRALALPALVLSGLSLAALQAVLAGSEPAPLDPEAVARQTLADARGFDATEIRVISTEPRDFADGSLDCPQPGAAYAQVITPGYRVLLEANGRRFDVRVAGFAGRICYQRKPSRNPSPGPQELGEAARADLALRLGMSPETVTILGLRRLTPGATLPGCGEVCASDAPPARCGMAVQLRTAERDVEYFALPTEVRPCPDITSR